MTKYNSDSIQTMRGLEGIRKNPSMYIGGTDAHGLFVILRELADNGVDEYHAGRNKSVAIKVDSDGTYWVKDSGAGIPQGMKVHEIEVNGKMVKSKMPTMQAVFGELHTSGKFHSDAYKVSIGCFAGDTEIELVDGRTLTMRQIHKEHKQGIVNHVWTVCRKTGNLRAQPIERAMLTGRTEHLVEVTLDTGATFTCTPNHPLYQTSLKKVHAENSHGASLLSADFTYDKDGYRVMPVTGDWPVRLHRVVAEYNGMDIEGNHVHHLDENVTNNEPTNLVALTPRQHYWEHPEKLEAWLKYVTKTGSEKSKLLKRRNTKGWYIQLQQQGKALKVACRIVYAGKRVNKVLWKQNLFHGAPGWKKAIKRFDSFEQMVEIATELVNSAKALAPKVAYAEAFLQSLTYTPGMSVRHLSTNQSDLMRAKRIVGKAISYLTTIPKEGADAAELDACFAPSKRGGVGARGLCQYIDLEEFVSAVRNKVDPCLFLYSDLSDEARIVRKNKFDKDDARVRVDGWGVAPVARQSNQFLRNVNAMLADKQPINQATYHARFKNAAGNSGWYLGVRACIRRGIKGRAAVMSAASEANHKVVSVKHVHLPEAVPVYDLSVGIDHNYRLACGVFVGNSHGVGVKGTNATSEFLDVVSCYKGKWYKIGFKKGKLTTPVKETTAPSDEFKVGRMKSGTLIHYKPDPTIFSVKSFPPSMLVEWAQMQAYLNPGLTLTVNIKGKQKSFFSKGGPRDYIANQLAALKSEAEADLFEFSNELATIAVAFSNADGFLLKGFTNGLTNSQGGKHVDSVAAALFKAIQTHKGAKQEFSNNDFRDGLLGIVNAKLHKASFSSQDKAKLTDDRMGKDFEAQIFEAAKKFFAANKAMAKRLCDRAAKINELKTKFKASKAVATELNKVKRQGLPPNYAPPHKTVPIKDRELLIVEGDSACFVGSTRFLLPDGKSMSFAEASALPEVSCVGFAGEAQALTGHKPRITKYVKQLVTVVFSDGREVTCTPEHRFLLTDGSYKEAQYLTPDDDLQEAALHLHQ